MSSSDSGDSIKPKQNFSLRWNPLMTSWVRSPTKSTPSSDPYRHYLLSADCSFSAQSSRLPGMFCLCSCMFDVGLLLCFILLPRYLFSAPTAYFPYLSPSLNGKRALVFFLLFTYTNSYWFLLNFPGPNVLYMTIFLNTYQQPMKFS